MKGKITEFKKKIVNNVHDSYTKDGTTYWKFIVTFDNGDSGTALSKSEAGNYTIGTEYTYESKENQTYGKQISGIKKVDGFTPGGGRPAYTPEEGKSISYQVAIEVATKYVEFRLLQPSESDYLKLIANIYKLLEPFCGERKTSILAQSAMKRAVDVAATNVQFEGMTKGHTVSIFADLATIFNLLYKNILTNGGTVGSST